MADEPGRDTDAERDIDTGIHTERLKRGLSC